MNPLLALYSVLVCTILIPLLIIGVGLIFGPITAICAFRDVLIEARHIERQDEEQVSRYWQPAYKMYAFGRGWYVTTRFTGHLFTRARRFANQWIGYAATVRYMPVVSFWFIRWLVQYVTWLIIVGLHVAARIQYVPAIVCAILFLILHTILLCVWLINSLVAIGVLSTIRLCYGKMRGSFIRCPHCYKEMHTPVYLCLACGTEHTRLWPNVYGLLAHCCKTCETNLPALDLCGRRRLPRLCSYCHRPLCSGVGEGDNIHIALVGGPSVGKTTYITMAIRELKKLYTKRRYTITFPDPMQQQSFESNLDLLASGQPLPATSEIAPPASVLAIQSPRTRAKKSVYIYDPAGEAFSTSENTGRQGYYRHADALIFIIDPFAIPAFYHRGWSSSKQVHQAERSSNLDIVQSYERMISTLETFLGLSQRKRYELPVAVVVTKVDTLLLKNEIGIPAAHKLVKRDPSIVTQANAIDRLVREFLCAYELDNVVRDIESHFSQVRYFSCSALGRAPTPDDTSGFIPTGVFDPMLWLLTYKKVIAL
jgi:Double-GTPase 2